MGRPLLGSPLRRRNAIHAYLNDAEYERVYHLAIQYGTHISGFFREVILAEVEKREKEATK